MPIALCWPPAASVQRLARPARLDLVRVCPQRHHIRKAVAAVVEALGYPVTLRIAHAFANAIPLVLGHRRQYGEHQLANPVAGDVPAVRRRIISSASSRNNDGRRSVDQAAAVQGRSRRSRHGRLLRPSGSLSRVVGLKQVGGKCCHTR